MGKSGESLHAKRWTMYMDANEVYDVLKREVKSDETCSQIKREV